MVGLRRIQGSTNHWFLRLCTWPGFCSTNLATIHDLRIDANKQSRPIPSMILHHALAPSCFIHFTLTYNHSDPQAHDRVLPQHITRLINCNFIIRLLSLLTHLPHTTYYILLLCCTFLHSLCSIAVCQLVRINALSWLLPSLVRDI